MSRITATAVIEDPALRSAVQSLVSEMPDTELLGIGERTLYDKLKKYGVD